ncbi:MAG: peptidylprolyl isomerase [Calditrichia bacterium]
MIRIGILLLLALLLSCNQSSDDKTLQKLTQIEYSRTMDDPTITGYLNSPKANVRARALEVVGRLQDTSKVVQVANKLKDSDNSVRAAAAFALGQMQSPKAAKHLSEALQSERDENLRVLMIEGLGKSGDERQTLQLRDYLESTIKPYQVAAATAAGVLAYRRKSMHKLTPYLSALRREATDSEISWSTTYGLYRVGLLRSFEDFSGALENGNALTRYYGLKGLSQMARLINSDAIKEYQRDEKVRELINTYKTRKFRRALTEQLEDSTWYVRVAALELFGAMGEETLQEPMVKMLEDPSLNVQVTAIQELGRKPLRNWYTRREMRRLYREAEDWRIRGEALTVLATMQGNEALRNVEGDLMNKPWPQNYFAIETLKEIETDTDPSNRRAANQTTVDKATQLLVALAQTDNVAQKTLALEALIRRKKPPVVEYFVQQLNTADMAQTSILADYFANLNPDLAKAAVDPLIAAYGRLETPRDLEALVPVISALDSIGDRRAVSFLEKELISPYASVRHAAEKAIKTIGGASSETKTAVRMAEAARWDFKPVSVDSSYRVKFFTTRGDFVIELNPEAAPVNVANLVSLVKSNFYNGIYFHRIIPGFVSQVGDPRGDGWGGPGYSVPCEYNQLPYVRGTVGMAHAGKDTGGSQIFVSHTPQPHLNGRHTVVGKIVSGMQIVDRLMQFDQILGTELLVAAQPKALANK